MAQEKKIEAWQIGKIKHLKKLRGMTDDDYYDTLWQEWGVKSCTQLSFIRANNLIVLWKKQAKAEGHPLPPRVSGPLKYNDLDGRGPEWPSGRQLRLLDTLFGNVSSAPPKKKDEAFAAFLLNRFQIAGVSHILRRDVQRIKKALDEMKRQRHENKKRAGKNNNTTAQRTT